MNFMVGWALFKYLNQLLISMGLCSHMKKILSIYLYQTLGLAWYSDRGFVSRDDMNRFAYDGATLVPIAVPPISR